MKILTTLGSTLALAAVAGGGMALHPELLDRMPDRAVAQPATTPAAATSGSSATRATVTSGMDPVTGKTVTGTNVTGTNAVPTYTFDSSLLGVPWTPGPTAELPELQLKPPSPGVEGSVTTRSRSVQFGHTTQWTAKPQVNGPVRRIVKTVADGGYVVVPPEAGTLHLLCGPGSASYYVDSHEGQWRVYRVDGGPHYDVSYRFVQYDRSPLAQQTPCQ